jgi:hypothetical protein
VLVAYGIRRYFSREAGYIACQNDRPASRDLGATSVAFIGRFIWLGYPGSGYLGGADGYLGR